MSLPRAIGLSGYARSGKDSVAAILAEKSYERIAFADQVRELALKLDPLLPVPQSMDGRRLTRLTRLVRWFGWEGAKEYPAVREYLQLLGQSVREVTGEDAWIDAAFCKVERGKRYVFTDCRYTNEAAAITDELQGEIWRIQREGAGPANDHISETDMEGYYVEAVLANNGTLEDLRENVLGLLEN